MKAVHLLALSAAMAAVTIFVAAEADAQRGPGVTIGGWSNPPSPRHGGGRHGKHRIHVPLFIVEREPPVVIEREIVREVPVAAAAAPPPPAPPRQPYVLGRTYASLPGACMKLIEDGQSYYLCNGDWYRQLGRGSYKAVPPPLG